jgi:hypothetical protein
MTEVSLFLRTELPLFFCSRGSLARLHMHFTSSPPQTSFTSQPPRTHSHFLSLLPSPLPSLPPPPSLLSQAEFKVFSQEVSKRFKAVVRQMLDKVAPAAPKR